MRSEGLDQGHHTVEYIYTDLIPDSIFKLFFFLRRCYGLPFVTIPSPAHYFLNNPSEVNSGFFYKTAADREAMVLAERKFIDDRVEKIIALKRQVCAGTLSFCLHSTDLIY